MRRKKPQLKRVLGERQELYLEDKQSSKSVEKGENAQRKGQQPDEAKKVAN